ncbi:MAG: peptidoglycan recognition family protein [Planctomycetota bacterium]|nr:peptidoglycan recognition family protein [Planctomycetota bacterium]
MARNTSKSKRGTRGAGKARASVASRSLSSRTRVVWGALLASMTVVGGGLVMLDTGERSTGEGFSLPPLAVMASAGGLESILSTPTPIESGRWQAIVIHDSGTLSGSPESLDEQARRLGLRGLGYHFVLGNGSGLRDGQVHVGGRWLRQNPGAHAAGKNADWLNRNAIGICVVGDGERATFTEAQRVRLAQLVEMLMRECQIPADRVYLHREVASTPSPGKFFPEASFRQAIAGVR